MLNAFKASPVKKASDKVTSSLFLLISLIFVVQAIGSVGHLFQRERLDATAVRADGSRQDPMDAVLIVDTSGLNQFLGREIAAGFQEALRANRSEESVRMVIRDSRGVPEASAALADGSAAGNRTLVIVGPTEAESVPPLLQSAKEGEVVALMPIGTPRREIHSKWSFSLQPPVFKQGQMLGKFLQRSVKSSRVARFVLEDAPPDGLWAGLIEAYADVGSEGLELVTWKRDQSAREVRDTISQNLYFDAVIISLPMGEARTIVRELRLLGYSGAIVVEGEASMSNFAELFHREPKEILKPGFFTDGLISLVPFLPTIASEKSQRLIMSYRERYQHDPSWAYAYGFDSGQLIADFVSRARASNTMNLSNPDLLRTNFRLYLDGLQSDPEPIFGYTGQLKFGQNNQRAQSPKLLIFKNNVQSPNFEQLADDPTLSFGSAQENDAITIGDEQYLLVPVVHTGVSIRSIDRVDFDTNSYGLTFDISFKSRQPIDIDDILFTNMIGEKKTARLLDDRVDHGVAFRRYRISGSFHFNPTSSDVILDRTTLSLSWRSRNLDANSMKFVIDPDYSEAAFHAAEKKSASESEVLADSFTVASTRLGVDNELIAEPGNQRSIGGVRRFSTATFQADATRQVLSLRSRFINSLGVTQLKVIFAISAVLFCIYSLILMFFNGPVARTIWWFAFTAICFFSEATLFTSIDQVGFFSPTLVFARYFFAFAFTMAAVRVIDGVFTLRVVKRARSSDVQPVINFLTRFGLYFSAIGFYYTIVLGRDLLPILATFSVLLTVFGLALRELIFDAIAGVAIAADGHIATGQWVNIRAKERTIHGVVQALGWRHVAIRSRDEQVHFVPNSVVATQILSNLSLGDGFSRVEIPFVMSANVALGDILPMLLHSVEVSLSDDRSVSERRPVKIVVGDLEDDRLRCVVQVYYAPSESVDGLRTKILRALQDVLKQQNALASQSLRLTRGRARLALT